MARVNQRRSVLVATLLAVFAIVAAACGSSSKSSAGNQAPSSSNTQAAGVGSQQPAGTPLKLGYIEDAVSLGAGGSNPYTIPAFNAWVKWTNAHGGISGHPVQLISRREPSNPGIALTDVQQLVGQGIVGLVDDDVNGAPAWTSYIEKAGIPVFSTTNPSLTLAGSSIDFTPLPSELVTPQMIVMAAAKVGAPTMATFYCSELPQCAQSVPALTAVGKKIGVTNAFSTSILGSAPNYTAQCLAAKEHSAQSLFVADASQIILRVAASCHEQGFDAHQITTGTNIQQNMAGAPGMEGMISADGTMPFFASSFPGVKTMTDAFNQYDPSLTKDPQYGDLSTSQWATGLLIAEAAKAGNVGTTNPLTAAALLDGIYTLHSTNLGGMTPTLTFERGGPHVNRCFFWAAIQKGKFAQPYGLAPACVPQ